jgi:lysophospholipase L1-like esterase/predicted esterase
MLGFALQKANPRANLEMINAGISGHTTVNALARIDKDVLAKKPHLVVIKFGMNDVTRVPLDTFRNNMRTIARRCLDVGSAVVLCTPNSVYENSARPNGRLAEFSQAVREVADELSLPLVDFFQDWQQLRKEDPDEWMLTMSDTIHPNMNGHKRFARLIAQSISGKEVSLDDLRPPSEALHHTFDRLHDQKPIKLVAMPPYDELLPALLRDHFPDAKFETIRWPIEGQSVDQLANWAKQIRGMKPDLVVPAVPANASAADKEAFVQHYEWVLNWSFQFAGRPWDVVPIMPTAAGELPVEAKAPAELARRIIIGKDVRFIDRVSEDKRPAQELIAAWIAEQKRTWQAARNELPPRNDHVHVAAQSWPHQPGPRTLKASIYYPGGKLADVNEQSGIMLTLHNWGGQDCAGTANPTALADRLNVVAVCVNYLQSGRKASIEDPQPYDVGYLQALDALRALGFVRRGLKKAGVAFDDGRVFCTGGSGGGNVTLMANKLAPRTFACVIDMCGMKKLSNDIAFNEPGGSGLNARWSRDPASVNYLAADEQEFRFAGNPNHLQTMKGLGTASKIIVVHGVDDATCPFADAEEMVANMKAAELDVEPHFIGKADLDGKVFTSSGHALGNRTEIVLRVAGKYLTPDGPDKIRRSGPCDFDLREDVLYETANGKYVISYKTGIPASRFEPRVEVKE